MPATAAEAAVRDSGASRSGSAIQSECPKILDPERTRGALVGRLGPGSRSVLPHGLGRGEAQQAPDQGPRTGLIPLPQASRVLVRHAPATAATISQRRMVRTATTAGIGSLRLFRALVDPGLARVPMAGPGWERLTANTSTRSRAAPRKVAR